MCEATPIGKGGAKGRQEAVPFLNLRDLSGLGFGVPVTGVVVTYSPLSGAPRAATYPLLRYFGLCGTLGLRLLGRGASGFEIELSNDCTVNLSP